jgi:hypothetical protein
MIPQTSNLKDAIQALYVAFADVLAPSELSVCTGCCMDLKLAKEMCKTPLNRLETKHFYDYNNAAEGNCTAEEMHYFAPRLLELFVLGESLHHSEELYLQRLKPMQDSLASLHQKQALQVFARAYFAEFLRKSPHEACSDAFNLLVTFHLGGFEIQLLLDDWLSADTVEATLHLAKLEYWCTGYFDNVFCGNRNALFDQMNAWITEPKHRAIFAERFLQLVDAKLPNMHLPTHWGWTMMDNVEFAFQKCA